MVESKWALFAWLVVFTNLTRTSMSLYHVPHIAMGAELTDNFRERSSVVGYRTFMGTFGALIAVFAGFRLFFARSPEFANGQLNEAASWHSLRTRGRWIRYCFSFVLSTLLADTRAACRDSGNSATET